MSEKGKGSMLLPLGIGAGLLLLLTSMKKKEAVPAAAATTDDAAALLRSVSAEEAAVQQIDPAPAPSYAQAEVKAAPSAPETNDEEDPEAGSADQREEEDPEADSADEEETDEGSYTAPSGKRSGGGGGSNTPYIPSSSIYTNRQPTPLPIAQSQAARAALQQARNKKSIRFQSDQAKKFAQRSGARSVNPNLVSNARLRAGVQLPVTYRPGVTTPGIAVTAAQQSIAITSQQASPTITPAVSQTTIFPLKFGTTSAYVKEVQRKLGVSATGYFGTLTRTAIQRRFRVSEISEALYKQIITGKVPVPVLAVRKPVPKIIRKVKKPLKPKIIKRR